MTYLDNSATTKIDEEVLKIVSKNLFTSVTANEIGTYLKEIQTILNTNLEPIITSGSSESNNLALKGLCEKTDKKEIITTHLEHSSVNETLEYLKTKGFIIKYIPIKDTLLDLEELEKLISKNTALISVTLVNSEIGMLNDINKIGKIAKKHNIPFHTDLTQGIGKIKIDLSNVDLASISSHKIHGPKGIGLLLKNKNLNIAPLIYGKRVYNLGLIKGMIKALELSQKDINSKYKKVEDLRTYLVKDIKNLPDISINESKVGIPHILNFSVLNYKPETFLHYLEMYDIYISTKSACSSGSYSEAVLDLTKDLKKAETSVRISLSEENTKEQLDKVIELIKRREHGR